MPRAWRRSGTRDGILLQDGIDVVSELLGADSGSTAERGCCRLRGHELTAAQWHQLTDRRPVAGHRGDVEPSNGMLLWGLSSASLGIDPDRSQSRRHLDFFPSDAIGAPAAKDGLGTELTVSFDGLSDPVLTDISGGNKLFFRKRDRVGEFFRRKRLKAGDWVRIERLGPSEFRVSRAR